MKKWTIWLIIALCLIILGGGIFVAVLAVNDWDFSKFGGGRYETKTYTLEEEFENITIDTDTADVVFLPSTDGKCKVVACEEEKQPYSVSVTDGTLNVKLVDERKWYDHISIFNFEEAKLTVYLPQTEYGKLTLTSTTGDTDIPKNFTFASVDIQATTGDVKFLGSSLGNIKIAVSTGDITMDGAQAKGLDLTVTTGNIRLSNAVCEGIKIDVSTGKSKLENVACKTLVSDGDTGDIELKNVIATESIYIERDTGDVRFEGMDGGEITIETDTGDVTGTLLSDKIFFVETDTGDKNVPQTTTGGKCTITTDTGDIYIRIAK